jgi:DNA recombination protein Rad52
MLTKEQIHELAAPLNRANVKDRVQSGRSLSYIEGWHAIAEANRIFGFDGWNRETIEIKVVAERARKIGRDGRDGWSVSYIARCRITVHSVVRDGVGSGHGIDADLGLAHESAIKEAETDAMKRALMTFGNPFGLALYDKDQKQVVTDTKMPVSAAVNKMLDDIDRLDTVSGLKNFWKNCADWREHHEIIKGSEAYDVVYGHFVARGKKLSGKGE